MSFVQIDGLSIAVRAEDIILVEVAGEDEGRWALQVHIRGREEPYKMFGDQVHLVRLYKALLSHLGNVTNIAPENTTSKVLGEIKE